MRGADLQPEAVGRGVSGRIEAVVLAPVAPLFCALLLMLIPLASADAKEADWFVYLGSHTPPKAPPKQMSAAEALPPLPLPATPLRRTERKKPPPPDYLVGKVIWGDSASFTDTNGEEMKIADWNLCPTDIRRLLEKARQAGLAYYWQNVNLSDFHYDPEKLPVLLFSGARTLRLSKAHIDALRNYVLDGGTVICDSIAGSPYFHESCKRAFLQALPECRFRPVPPDHPLLHMLADVGRVTVRGGTPGEPRLECMYIGSRVGVLLSPHGLGCGWNRDLHRVAQVPQATFYPVKDAQAIGLNLIAYCVGYHEAALVESRPELYGRVDQKEPTNEFVFAQIKHNGAWNVHPGAATTLLGKVRQHTTIRVNLKRQIVDPEVDDLSAYAFLYLTGMDEFTFAPQAVTALKAFLRSGGFLFINNGLGLSTFDRAVRRELARIIPGATLQAIPATHDLFKSPFKIEEVRYCPAVTQEGDLLGGRPRFRGIVIGGEWRVLYSPYDLEAGWLPADYPLIRGYESQSAERLGMNVIAYIMTH